MKVRIAVVSRSGNVVEIVRRELTMERGAVKLDKQLNLPDVPYKGKKYPLKDMRYTVIDDYAIYPWGGFVGYEEMMKKHAKK